MARNRLLVHSARQIVQVVDNGARILKGEAMKHLAILEAKDGHGLSIVVDSKGNISALGPDKDVKDKTIPWEFDDEIDASGQTIIPGLVDGHTHSVWTGDRVHEFAMKLAGASYMEVHEAGGGIHFTVDRVRKATEDHLYGEFKKYMMRMLEAGTTLAEVKSGYGLDADTEVKMLRVMERGRRDQQMPVDISATYCGAHAIPKNSNAEDAVQDILSEQLPRIQELMTKGELTVENMDVFCEKGVFSVEQTKAMLQAAQKLGLAINFHGEELHLLHSAEMGAELGARAISHLEEVSDAGIAAMASSGTCAVLLPTTAYILRLTPPPARKMLAGGVPVALGSDFNPNAHCLAMPMVMHLACVLMKMTMTEALTASTINAAASVGKSETHGSLEIGKYGDMLILDAPRWEHLIYQFGSYQHVIKYVIKNGKVAHCNK